MELKGKITLYCFEEVKCKQGFITGICYLYNALGLSICLCISGLMVSESELSYSDPGAFPERRGYEFTFQFF